MKKYGMDATALDKQVAALRESDALVAGRLAELDAKLTTWLAAMRAAMTGLEEIASRERLLAAAAAAESAPNHASGEPCRTVDVGVPLSDRAAAGPTPVGEGSALGIERPRPDPVRGHTSASDTAADQARGLASEALRAGTAARASARQAAAETTPVACGLNAATTDVSAVQPGGSVAAQAPATTEVPSTCEAPSTHAAPSTPEVPATSAAPAVDAAAEDELLLSQLDPETANALRVKRRLTGNRKSIRQLLDEMRAGSGPGGLPPANKGKRWWR